MHRVTAIPHSQAPPRAARWVEDGKADGEREGFGARRTKECVAPLRRRHATQHQTFAAARSDRTKPSGRNNYDEGGNRIYREILRPGRPPESQEVTLAGKAVFRRDVGTASWQLKFLMGIDGRYETAGQEFFVMKDHQGSVRAVADATGRIVGADDYLPYGKAKPLHVSSQAGNPPWKWQGKELDADGQYEFYYFGARYWNPDLGIWLTPDPAGQFANPYGYGGDPINGVDPDGNASIGIAGGSRAAALAGGGVEVERRTNLNRSLLLAGRDFRGPGGKYTGALLRGAAHILDRVEGAIFGNAPGSQVPNSSVEANVNARMNSGALVGGEVDASFSVELGDGGVVSKGIVGAFVVKIGAVAKFNINEDENGEIVGIGFSWAPSKGAFAGVGYEEMRTIKQKSSD